MGIDGLAGPYEFDPQVDPLDDDFLQPWPSRSMGRYAHDLTRSLYEVILQGSTGAEPQGKQNALRARTAGRSP